MRAEPQLKKVGGWVFPVIEIRDVAVKFLKWVTAGKIDEAFEECVAENFKHHNVYFKGDRDSLRQAMKESHKQFPHTTLEIKHVIEQHHTVAVHSFLKNGPGEFGMAVVHIMRFDHDQIVEMWDVGQLLPEKIMNELGAF